MKVFRIVIDSYPTTDGLPFSEGITPLEEVSEWLVQNHAVQRRILEPNPNFDEEEAVSFPGPRRNYLSRSSAVARLKVFESFGCTGHVESSDPITWSAHE